MKREMCEEAGDDEEDAHTKYMDDVKGDFEQETWRSVGDGPPNAHDTRQEGKGSVQDDA